MIKYYYKIMSKIDIIWSIFMLISVITNNGTLIIIGLYMGATLGVSAYAQLKNFDNHLIEIVKIGIKDQNRDE